MPCFAVLLFVLLVGCGSLSNSRPTPSVSITPSGNAWAVALPKGTRIDPVDSQLAAVAINEIQSGVVIQDVTLVSKSWLIERDEREMELLKLIEKLKIKSAP